MRKIKPTLNTKKWKKRTKPAGFPSNSMQDLNFTIPLLPAELIPLEIQNEYVRYSSEFGPTEPTQEELFKFRSKKWREEDERGEPMGWVLEINCDASRLDRLVLVRRARLRRLTVFSSLLCRSRLHSLHVPWHSLLLKMKSCSRPSRN
ncbi:hypothetical protein P3L10_011371 [Capsicum annuum]